MIKNINHDPRTLRKKALKATKADAHIVTDLLDTLKAHQEQCVGMAANMIGENKQIIACQVGPLFFVLLNPRIIAKSSPYSTKEGCLSLKTLTQTTRYKKITVRYQDDQFRPQTQEFTGFSAQIIQHEIDHLNGILI